jgi:uracil phosphoribosyltransferase
MIHCLDKKTSVANHILGELRDIEIQSNSYRFRNNLQRIGGLLAYEISKTLNYQEQEIETPMGTAQIEQISDDVVISAILRAGLPVQQGMLEYLTKAESAFVASFRKHHKDGTFEVYTEYSTAPDIEGKVLIVVDAMLATGSSMHDAIDNLLEFGKPASIHIVSVIASSQGIDHLRRFFPLAKIWTASIDDELTAKSYIVPGLGDAGDLAFGEKNREQT